MKSKSIPNSIHNSYGNHLIIIGLVVICMFSGISPPLALLLGFVTAQFIENPLKSITSNTINWLLKLSVIGLGFGMNAQSAIQASISSLWLTMGSIVLTLCIGLALGRYLGVDNKISQLISSGTAICGGSAIAAISPIIKADKKQISMALGIVFALNSLALFIFPIIGQYFEMSQYQFGVWCAIAIHDTSSVIGAAEVYGNEALQVATTVKLARALWILPVSLLFMAFSKKSSKKIKIPYFIGLFILAVLANTYLPSIGFVYPYIVHMAKIGLIITLFLIGLGLTKKALKALGAKAMVLGTITWIVVATTTLIAILFTVSQ